MPRYRCYCESIGRIEADASKKARVLDAFLAEVCNNGLFARCWCEEEEKRGLELCRAVDTILSYVDGRKGWEDLYMWLVDLRAEVCMRGV